MKRAGKLRALTAGVAMVGGIGLGPAAMHAAPSHTSPPASEAPTADWSIEVTGAVAAPVTLTADDLAALEQHGQTATFESRDGFQTRVFDGPLLFDVLGLAEPAFDPDVNNDKLGHTIVVTASDGYVGAVAWGEIDPEFEGKPMLLALTEDGVVLDGGPRLTAPGDRRGGRYVSDVVAIAIVGPG